MAFSGETGIPPSSLGIIHDQPSSAEAIRAAEHDLLIDATYHNKHVLTPAVRDIATLAVMVRDSLSEPPAEAWRLSARFVDPEFRSMSATADGVQKLAADMDTLTRYPVLLESVFDDAQVDRIMDDQRRANGRMVADMLSRDGQSGPDDSVSASEQMLNEARGHKEQFDALGVAIRAGVDPEDAARIIGLEGIGFTGAVPVSLRLPNSDAEDVEEG